MSRRYPDSPTRDEIEEKCETCGGTGEVKVTSSGGTIICLDCKGTGKKRG